MTLRFSDGIKSTGAEDPVLGTSGSADDTCAFTASGGPGEWHQTRGGFQHVYSRDTECLKDGIIEAGLGDAIIKDDINGRFAIRLRTCSPLAIGPLADNHSELTLDITLIPAQLLTSLVERLCLRHAGEIVFPPSHVEKWMDLFQWLGFCNRRAFEQAFHGERYINHELRSSLCDLGGSFRAKAGNVEWLPSVDSLSPDETVLILGGIVDPERKINPAELLALDNESPIIKRFGGAACLDLLRAGATLSIVEWAHLASGTQQFEPCSVERRVALFRAEWAIIKSGFGLQSQYLSNRTGRNLTGDEIQSAAEAIVISNGLHENPFWTTAVKDLRKAEAIIRLRSLMPELAALPSLDSIVILKAVCEYLDDSNADRLDDSIERASGSSRHLQRDLQKLFGISQSRLPSLAHMKLDSLTMQADKWLRDLGFEELLRTEIVTSCHAGIVGDQVHFDLLRRKTSHACRLLWYLSKTGRVSTPEIRIAPMGRTEVSDKLRAQLSNDIQQIRAILGGTAPLRGLRVIEIHADHESPNGYRPAAGGSKIKMGRNGSMKDLFHEAGHHVEDGIAGVYTLCQSFVLSRRTRDALEPLSTLIPKGKYRPDEMAYRGNFIHPYAGKVYVGQQSTEIFSMGFQYFASTTGVAFLAQTDPTHFLLTLGIILGCRGEI